MAALFFFHIMPAAPLFLPFCCDCRAGGVKGLPALQEQPANTHRTTGLPSKSCSDHLTTRPTGRFVHALVIHTSALEWHLWEGCLAGWSQRGIKTCWFKKHIGIYTHLEQLNTKHISKMLECTRQNTEHVSYQLALYCSQLPAARGLAPSFSAESSWN